MKEPVVHSDSSGMPLCGTVVSDPLFGTDGQQVTCLKCRRMLRLPAPSQLVCAECGYAREVVLTDDQGRLVTVAEYMAALELVGERLLCSECARPRSVG